MEKKLTDEEIVKALEWASKTSEWTASVAGKEQNMFCAILDLINRQQAEIERLTKLAELRLRDNKDTCKLLLEKEKQVDELKEKQVIECHGMLKGCDLVKQAVKDTAKEIYTQVLEWLPVGEDYSVFIHNIEQWLKEKYGVEVE